MNWLLFAELIAKYGIPLAEALFQKWSEGGVVTQGDINELKILAMKTPESQVLDAALRAGLNPDDPKVVALLEMLKPQNPT